MDREYRITIQEKHHHLIGDVRFENGKDFFITMRSAVNRIKEIRQVWF